MAKTKMERKRDVLLKLIDDWEKLSKEALKLKEVKKSKLLIGEIFGELRALGIMKKFIIKAWRR